MYHDNQFTLETNASLQISSKSYHTKIRLNTLSSASTSLPIRGLVVAEPWRSASVEMASNPLINPLLDIIPLIPHLTDQTGTVTEESE